MGKQRLLKKKKERKLAKLVKFTETKILINLILLIL